MRGSIRLAITACAALATLAFVGSAWADYAPSLYITALNNAPGKPSTTVLGHVQAATDDATYKDTIYAPVGYRMSLNQRLGLKIGDVSARYILRNNGNMETDVNGLVKVDDPAAHLSDSCAPGQHAAVWRLSVAVAQTPVVIYLYVDPITSGPEALFASGKIQFCLEGPPGTPPGAQLLFAFFSVKNVFTNPPNTADRLWRATFTPFTAGTATPNPAGTTEGQAVVPGRVSLSLTVKRLKHGVVLLQGRLFVDRAAYPNAVVELYSPGKSLPVGQGKTNRTGRFTIRKKIKRKTRFSAEVIFIGDLASCPATPLPEAPQGCKTATRSFAIATGYVVARPRK